MRTCQDNRNKYKRRNFQFQSLFLNYSNAIAELENVNDFIVMASVYGIEIYRITMLLFRTIDEVFN